MTIPGTIPRGKTEIHRGSTSENSKNDQASTKLRQSAAESFPSEEKEKPITRREYFRQLLPEFGNRLTRSVRRINSAERDIRSLIDSSSD